MKLKEAVEGIIKMKEERKGEQIPGSLKTFWVDRFTIKEKEALQTLIDFASKVPKKKDNKAIYEQYFQGEYEWVNDKGNMVMLSKAVRAVEQAIDDFHKEG